MVREVVQTLQDTDDVSAHEIEDGFFIVAGRVSVKDLGGGIIEVADLQNSQSVTIRSVDGAVDHARTYLARISSSDT